MMKCVGLRYILGGGGNEKDVWFKGKRPLGDLDTEPTVTLQGI